MGLLYGGHEISPGNWSIVVPEDDNDLVSCGIPSEAVEKIKRTRRRDRANIRGECCCDHGYTCLKHVIERQDRGIS